MAAGHATSFISHSLFIYIAISLLLPMANEGATVYGDSRSFSKDEKRLTREYDLRQGALRGLIVKPGKNYDLQPVEMFLGIPYAAPPVGNLRFMPPGEIGEKLFENFLVNINQQSMISGKT